MRTDSMKDTYISVSCSIPADLEDQLPVLLAPWGVLGTEIGDHTGSGIRVTVFLPGADADGADGVGRLLVDHGANDVEQGSHEAEDWLAAYREVIRPFEVGDGWWIDPHPDRPTTAPTGRQRLVVEPRMAFGTGTHESTQAILIELEEIEISSRKVLDVGTGSGILAFAAECLGAESVVGLDIDETAVWVAVETARQQEWESRVSFVVGPVGCLGGVEFDIVLCNMITSSFLPLAGDLRKSLGPTGIVVFSGLLATEVNTVSELLASARLKVISTRYLGDWASLVAVEAEFS